MNMTIPENIDHNTKLIGVIGHPIKHSFSPRMHNLCFQLQKLNFIYLPFDIPASNLKDSLKSLITLGVKGFNVTIPHKEKIIQYLHHVSEEASIVGSVNTVVNESGQLFGYNTDINGIVETLMPYKDDIAKCTVSIIGAGGSARSVLYSLIRNFKVEKINIINRTEERSEALKDYFKDKMKFDNIFTYELMPQENIEILQSSKLIINTTSVGMYPNLEESPIDIDEPFNSDQIVFDLIYNPMKSKFLQIAESKNAVILDGLNMFVVQGAKSFEMWTGTTMDIEHVYGELKDILSSSDSE